MSLGKKNLTLALLVKTKDDLSSDSIKPLRVQPPRVSTRDPNSPHERVPEDGSLRTGSAPHV